ncbi:MAG: hypothetical protein HC852_02205 [Acaryochloridaceae cyanobacterium RU_4_10]|nr:hypothetical protein [Microcoleus sp. SU_5_6]NJM74784.1 hypothetical protein [Acaryochloridaceae cyanobacterium RU_4_10]
MIKQETLAQVWAFPGWVVGVSCSQALVYRCWAMNADLDVFNDGEFYDTSSAAMAAGRRFVEQYLR